MQVKVAVSQSETLWELQKKIAHKLAYEWYQVKLHWVQNYYQAVDCSKSFRFYSITDTCSNVLSASIDEAGRSKTDYDSEHHVVEEVINCTDGEPAVFLYPLDRYMLRICCRPIIECVLQANNLIIECILQANNSIIECILQANN